MKVRLVVMCAFACGRVGFNDEPVSDAASDAAAVPDTAMAEPDAGEADKDADGIADAVDNCFRIANADQHNEDGDRFGDACDPCPPLTDLDPVADADDDGVSDLCDPFPAVAGDQIVMFDGFAASPSDAEIVGSWVFKDDQARVASQEDALSAVTWPVTTAGRHTIAASGTIDALFGTDKPRPVGVVQQLDVSTDDGFLCVFGVNPSNSPVFAIANNRTDEAKDAVMAVASVGSTSTFALTETIPGTYRCAGSAAREPLMADSSLASDPNRLGLFTSSASAHFTWAMIIASP